MARDAPGDTTMARDVSTANDVSSLNNIGKQLLQPDQPKDVLLKLLKQASSLFMNADQSPPAESLAVMKPCIDALVRPALMKHKDRDVRLLVATCVSEVMRIVAPEAPYDDDVLKEVFGLLVSTFEGLNDVGSPSFTRRVQILETVAKVRSCVVMLDLECDDLILQMFKTFLSAISDTHPANVSSSMTDILSLVFEDSEVIAQPLLEVVFMHLLKDRKGVSPAAHKIAAAVIQHCKEKLEGGVEVQRFLTSVMAEGSVSDLHEYYHDLIYEIYSCIPEILLGVLPNLTQELLTEKEDVRINAVKLLGKMFALPGRDIPQQFRQLFAEFIRRFKDKSPKVRVAILECAEGCVIANPSGQEAKDIVEAIADRLQDFEEKVRVLVVKVLCDLSKRDLKIVSVDIMKKVADRLRDKKVSLRKDTFNKLAEVYRTFCSLSAQGSVSPEDLYEWIPGRLVRCVYDKDCKDFRPQGLENVLSEDLFSPDLSVEERVKHWIAIFANFDKVDQKALERVLVHKQRCQQEMQTYLSLRQKVKEEDNADIEKKIQSSFKAISVAFVDPTKAEEHLQKLHQMKDNNIFKTFGTLLEPDKTLEQSREACEDLLKRLTDKQHPQYEFMKSLSTMCSYMLFGKEHVRATLKLIPVYKGAGKSTLLKASLGLLVEIASVFPSLIQGTDKDLLELLKESDESVKEGVVHILAKAGGSIRDQIAEGGSSVDETLEKMCLEGSRKQAKYAVSAIATVTADSGLKTLSLLYGRLVDSLDDKPHLPTILQSLGCISQHSTPVYETRESDIVRFVVQNLLKLSSTQPANSWGHPSEECQLKIYGLKTLVKSFLPNRDAHLRQTAKLDGLLGVISKLLESGEISAEVQSSNFDKAHIRLAAAKGVLRLAGRWDKEIQPEMWMSTMLVAQDPIIEVRQRFIEKVQHGLKERSLPHKYASAFILCGAEKSQDILNEAKKFTAEFIESCRREARARHLSLSSQLEGSGLASHPEYVLTYLVHVIAHHPQYPMSPEALGDAASYEPFQRQLHFYLRALLQQDGESKGDAGKKEEVDNIPAVLAIFAEIKRAEDAVDATKSENLYTVADIGAAITKELARKRLYSGAYAGEVPLPSALYKVPEAVEGAESKVDGSHMPPCLLDGSGQLKLKFVTSRAVQPSSPRGGAKRVRKAVDGDSAGEEAGKEDNDEHVPKKSRSADAAQGITDPSHQTPAPAKSQRGRKRNSAPSRAAVKNEQQQDVVPEKKKRGRPRKVPEVVVEPQEVSDGATISVENTLDDAEDAPSSKEASGSATKRLGSSKKSVGNQKTPVSSKKSAAKPSGETSSGRKPKKASAEAVRTASPPKRRATEGPKQTPKAKLPKNADTDTPIQAAKQSTTPAAEKSTGKAKGEEPGDELVNARVKVWWPLDKEYYKGRVTQYDAKTKKHKILYDDGDVENLRLSKERWTIIKEESSRKKRASEAPSTPTSSQNNQRGKLKKAFQGASLHDPAEKTGASDGPDGEELNQSPGGRTEREPTTESGSGMQDTPAQDKSGGLTSEAKHDDASSPPPSSPSNAGTTPAPAVDPFALDLTEADNDQPLVDKGGGTKAKSSGRGAHKATVGDTMKIKRAVPPSNAPAESGSAEKKVATDGATKSGSETGAAENSDDEAVGTVRVRKGKVR